MSILMTVEELAKYLKIKPDTIYKKVRKGELPAIKLGKLVRFPKELIDEWIIDHATKTMNDIKAAKKLVEKKVGKVVGQVEDAVEHAMESAKEQAEHAVEEVKKTQHELTKNIKGLWKDLQSSISNSPRKTAKKKASKKTKTNGKNRRIVASRRKGSASAAVN